MSTATWLVRVGRTVWGTFKTKSDALAVAGRTLRVPFKVEQLSSRVQIARMSVHASHKREHAWLTARPSFDLDTGVY